MKRIMWLVAVMLVALTVTPAAADFYVIAGGGRMGTAITTVPFVINSPGLYCLAGNLSYTPTTGAAITVNASDVTIDLMGFCLTGPGKASGDNDGIKIQDGASNVEIRNGSINNFGQDGIAAVACTGIRVLGFRVREVGKVGIHLTGIDHMVAGCSVINAGRFGIQADTDSCLFKGNHVAGSVSSGLAAGPGSTVADNLVQSNGGRGILAFGYCTITGNTARNNFQEGIYAGDYSTIANNTTDGLTYGAHCNLGVNTEY